VEVLKRLFTRERPHLPVGLSWLVTVPDRFSFPSGHATAGLAIALPLATALPAPAGVLVLLLGAAVGVSRCYLGVHYPGDVLAGWALASSTTLAVCIVGG
jgi:undecaprenyl-diphosphatase